MTLNNIGSNQTLITLSNGIQVLFSYNTPVAAYLPESGEYVVTEVKYSSTTSKHINSWAGKGNATRPQAFFDNLAA